MLRTHAPTTVVELRDKILALTVSHPKPSVFATRWLVGTPEGRLRFARACEAIGPNYARMVFDGLSPAQWDAVERSLRDAAPADRPAEAESLLEVYTALLAESLGWDPSRSTSDPFAFLHRVSDALLSELIRDEDPAHVALIATFWTQEEMIRPLKLLPPESRKQAVLQIGRLERVPREAAERAAERFAKTLELRAARAAAAEESETAEKSEISEPAKASNVIQVSKADPVNAALERMRGSVDRSREQELREFLRREAPKISARVEQALSGEPVKAGSEDVISNKTL